MKITRLKFYADTPKNEKNKFFCWNCNLLQIEDCIIRFYLKGFDIRAAWFEEIDNETGEVIENTRLSDLQTIYNKATGLSKKEKERILGIDFTITENNSN